MPMHDDLELMQMHVEALFTHDARGRLLRVNELGGRVIAPRVFFGRTRVGHVLRVRTDIADDVAEELQAIARDEPVEADPPQRPHCGALLRATLARGEPTRQVWAGPAYCIDATTLPNATNATRVERDDSPLLRTFPDWHGEVALRQPFVVAVDGDAAVAVCCSVRITPRAHAAGVETLLSARRRGFATHAVVGWAHAVAERGVIPLYSTSWDNVASQAVAARLRMHLYGVDFHVT
jgi:hypothetical protein